MQAYERLDFATQAAREALGRDDFAIERVAEGGSTAVYRITQRDSVTYLRVLPEQGASFVPEAEVHRVLLARGLHVPRILYVEPYYAQLQRSAMLTSAIAGRAIGYAARPAGVEEIVRDAGRELAVVNQIAVEGFGWIRRDLPAGEALQAECVTYSEWLMQDYAPVFGALGQALAPDELQGVHAALAEAAELFANERATLAHGDFDATHVYHQYGRYSGIIDFGEIRGAQALYDVGHFAIENADLLPALLEGYRQAGPLPEDYGRRIDLSTLLIAARRLGRRLARGAGVFEPDRQAILRVLPVLARM